jgi:hypothetical protein
MRVCQIPEHNVYGYVLKSLCISGRIREALESIREPSNVKSLFCILLIMM